MSGRKFKPKFAYVAGVGREAIAQDVYGNIYIGVESETELDEDSVEECSICGENVYIGWMHQRSHLVYCPDCVQYTEGVTLDKA